MEWTGEARSLWKAPWSRPKRRIPWCTPFCFRIAMRRTGASILTGAEEAGAWDVVEEDGQAGAGGGPGGEGLGGGAGGGGGRAVREEPRPAARKFLPGSPTTLARPVSNV